MRTRLHWRVMCVFFCASVLLLGPAGAAAQEAEPNDTCETAQPVDANSLPVSLTGSLDSTESFADLDYYLFTATPGTSVQVDLEGASTGAGTLGDPFLGWFGTDCQLQEINGDNGVNSNSRLIVLVPESGSFVVGASYCCDYDFVGGGEGSYTLTVGEPTMIGSISGTVQDAETLLPLRGDGPPFTSLVLIRCYDFNCYEPAASLYAGSEGEFNFTTHNLGGPLPAGVYQLRVSAHGYEVLFTEPFEVAVDQDLDLGLLELEPLHLIGSVSGRLLDVLDGSPVIGFHPTNARIFLEYCEGDYCSFINAVFADEMGRFRFDGLEMLGPVGDYLVYWGADGYWPAEGMLITVGRNEHVDLGDLFLEPIPVRFGEQHNCEVVEGQECEFGVDIGVRVDRNLAVEAWSLVQFWPSSDPGLVSVFQVGAQGADNPRPQMLLLKPGRDIALRFKVKIPDALPDNFRVCTSIYIGGSPYPQMDLMAEYPSFCAYQQNGVLRMMSDKEMRKFLLESRGHAKP